MNGLYYQLIECNIRILNVKLDRLHIMGEKLLLSKPSIFFPNKRKEWNKQLDDIFEEEMKIQEELLNEYIALEELFEKKSVKN